MLRNDTALAILRKEFYEIACKQDVERLNKFVELIKSEEDKSYLYFLLNVEENPIDLLFKNGEYEAAKFLVEKFSKDFNLGLFKNNESDFTFLIDCYMNSVSSKLLTNDPKLTEVTIFFSKEHASKFIYALSKNTSLVVINFGINFFNEILSSDPLQQMCVGIFKTLQNNQALKELNFCDTNPRNFNYFIKFNNVKDLFIRLLECNSSLLYVGLPRLNPEDFRDSRDLLDSAIETYTDRNKIYAIWNVFEKIKNMLIGLSDKDSSLMMFPIELIGVIASSLTSFLQIPNSKLIDYAKQFHTSYSPRNEILFWNVCGKKRNEIYICEQVYKQLGFKIFDLKFTKDSLTFSNLIQDFQTLKDFLKEANIENFIHSKHLDFNKDISTMTLIDLDDIKNFFKGLKIPELQIDKLMEHISNFPIEQKTMRNSYR